MAELASTKAELLAVLKPEAGEAIALLRRGTLLVLRQHRARGEPPQEVTLPLGNVDTLMGLIEMALPEGVGG